MNNSGTITPTKRLRKALTKLRGHDPNVALEELEQSVAPESAPEVRLARNPQEVEEISRIDQMIYGSDSIDVAGLYSWWRHYPLGVYVLWKGGHIVGGFGIWPLKETSYQKLIRG